MKTDCYISIIIPIYNSEKYIVKCVESLFCQNVDCLEYIFVDDGSSDNSIFIIKSLLDSKYNYRKKFVKFIRLDKNEGIANARNIGLGKAHGKYIGFVDSDDWIESNMFSMLYKKAKENDADIIGCNFFNEYSNSDCIIYQQPYNESSEKNIHNLLTGELFPSLWCEIVKRSLYEKNKVNFVSGINMGEDLLVNIKLFKFARRVSYVDVAFYHYRHSITSVCAIRSFESIMSDIHVASLIDNFLIGERLEEKYRKEILYRKFFAKLPLWTMDMYRDVILWRNTFPESNKYIFSYSRLDWKMKLEYWLASHHMDRFAIIFTHILSFKARFRLLLLHN